MEIFPQKKKKMLTDTNNEHNRAPRDVIKTMLLSAMLNVAAAFVCALHSACAMLPVIAVI